MSETAVVGHNAPPVDHDALTARLSESHADRIARCRELSDALARVPDEFADTKTAEKAADFIKQLQAEVKTLNALRVEEKEPYLEGGRRVDGFFKNLSGGLERVKSEVSRRLTAYQRKIEEEERQRRAEEARVAEEAARKAREAAEREAAALAEKETAEAAEQDQALDNAIEADETARQAAEDAAAAQKAAEARAAAMTQQRSSVGSVASLRTTWEFRDLDRASLDLETLRPHLPEKALEQAVRSFIKAGGRTLAGVEIYEHKESVVR